MILVLLPKNNPKNISDIQRSN